ncbi:LysM peptidoglycan-binding domain-containing protein [Leifsonia sp. Root112D2]|jgi:LysM repeat protein|uniref:LysM peptidoglycan-binding domain-containing protein n=1 Tax=Leifsonia sp. Root112D2 TaxID=1736426 RepID=UPI0009EB077B|nr:LysM peptidoglycan-binding domain-containing protein [Leifsonia sp. Root112D2]
MAITDLQGTTGHHTSAARIPRHAAPTAFGRRSRSLIFTVPLVIVGTIAASLNLATPAQAFAPAKRVDKAKSGTTTMTKTVRGAVHATSAAPSVSVGVVTTAAVAPRHYTVAEGDTISGIAGHFGLATASVLALNGLSWKSLIFPGQVLALTAAAPVVAQAPVAQTLTRYTVVAGDTISGIAAAHGVSTQAVLSANGLSASSIIFPRQSITIPRGTVAAHVHAAKPAPVAPKPAPVRASSVVPFTAEMRHNAAIIVAVGRKDGVPDQGIVIALAAAMQESGLRNLDYGDADSLGLFQQRPSTGWGPAAQIMDPATAALAFFGGANNPNPGRTRGLLDIDGWQKMTLTQAAQAVQISAYPTAYAQWEAPARAWLAAIG